MSLTRSFSRQSSVPIEITSLAAPSCPILSVNCPANGAAITLPMAAVIARTLRSTGEAAAPVVPPNDAVETPATPTA